MKITINKREEIEIDLKFPSYYKEDNLYMLILSEQKCVKVSDYDFKMASIGYAYTGNIDFKIAEPITKKQYYAVFDKVMHKLATADLDLENSL
jgi:hypothetical protein